jgi:hypothetical protein
MRLSPAWAVGQTDDGGDMEASPLRVQAAAEARARSSAVRKVRIVGFLRTGSGELKSRCPVHAEKLASERSRVRIKDFMVELQGDEARR